MLIWQNIAHSEFLSILVFQVVFLVGENENILTRERLQEIHFIEKKIMQHEKFPEFCYKDIHPSVLEDPAVKAINGCAPLNSLLTYFFPSTDSKGNVFYDGLGDNMDKVESALKLAMTSTHFYYYVDDKINSSNLQSRLIRTEVLFGAPLKGNTVIHDLIHFSHALTKGCLSLSQTTLFQIVQTERVCRRQFQI